MTPCPGNIRHGVLWYSALPVALCPGGLQALLRVELGVAATAAGQPGARTRDRDTPAALCWLTLRLQFWGQQEENSHKPQREQRSGERLGWSRCLTTCLALDSFPDPGLVVVVLEHLLMAFSDF